MLKRGTKILILFALFFMLTGLFGLFYFSQVKADPLAVGDSYEGGVVAYILQEGDPGYDAELTQGLIAAPSEPVVYTTWGCEGTGISGADGTAIGTGPQNTLDIIAGCSTAGIAAKEAADLDVGGYDDWYLPSKDELYKLYLNRVAIGGFTEVGYWSSSEIDDNNAWALGFNSGNFSTLNKGYTSGWVRPVRSFTIGAVTITDSNLESCIRTALAIPSGPISETDAATLTSLTCHGSEGTEITDLTGLEYFTNLTSLDLLSNAVSDLSPIAGITALQHLSLNYNSISDVSDLSGLTNLTSLELGGNSVTDISSLSGLVNLTYLDLNYNTLSSISVVSNFTDLTVLYLDSTGTRDLSALAGLTAMYRLYLGNNSISDISDLSAMTSLSMLTLNGNSISDISVISNFTALTYLELSDNNITDVTPLDENSGWGIGDVIYIETNPLNLAAIALLDGIVDDHGATVHYNTYCGNLISEPTVGEQCDDGNNTDGDGCSASCQTEIEITFTDSNFEDCVRYTLGAGYEEPRVILNTDVNHITNLNCSSRGILDVNGLDYFTGLEVLNLYNNSLPSIDLSPNTALRELTISNNGLTSIDVTNNAALTTLYAYHNELSGIDVSYNTNLVSLSLYDNNLTEIDVSNNTSLVSLELNQNSLSAIDVTANTDLEVLDLNNNSIASIDVSNNTRLSNLDLYTNDLTSIDVSNNPALQVLSLGINSITSLDVSTNTALTSLDVHMTPLTALDVSNNLLLQQFNAYLCNLSEIDISNNTELTAIDVSFNHLTSIDISTNTLLMGLDVAGNNLTSVDLSHNPDIVTMELNSNALTSIDLSYSPNVIYLDLSWNELTSIDVTMHTNLTNLYLTHNHLTTIDVTNNTLLSSLALEDNSLSSIDVTYNTNLYYFPIGGNNILSLSTLVANAGLGAGDYITVNNNPLNHEAVDDIATLVARGATVYWNRICGNDIVEASYGEQCDDGNNTNGDGCDYVCQTEAPVEVNFNDAILEACVRDALDIPEPTPIMSNDAAELTYLDCQGDAIEDLTGLSYFTGLTELNLLRTDVSDLTPIADLTQLTSFSLGGGTVTDFSAIAGYTNLTNLTLINNNISSLEFVSALNELTILVLTQDNITDISDLSTLTNLQQLTLNSNSLSDLAALSGLHSLTMLSLWGCSVSDVSDLSGLTSISTLYLADNNISDISSLASLSSLSYLDMRNNNIIDISSLESLTGLSILHAQDNDIADISPLVNNADFATGDFVNLSGNPVNSYLDIQTLTGRGVSVTFNYACGDGELEEAAGEQCDDGNNTNGDGCSAICQDETVTFEDTNLEACVRSALAIPSEPITGTDAQTLTSLNCDYQSVEDLSGLEYFTNLTALSLNDTTHLISDLTPLSGLDSLTSLSLYGGNITDISPLAGLSLLTDLDLRSNYLTSVSALSGMSGMQHLQLGSNSLMDISPLVGLTALYDLDLSSNSISNLIPLESLTSLNYLNLSGNSISDIDPLAGLSSLQTLFLNTQDSLVDISAIESLTGLRDLRLSNNHIVDISPLSSLTSLTYLELNSNDISDISTLDDLTSLTSLYLGINPIVTSSASLPGSLTYLVLYQDTITDIHFLSSLTSLTHLELQNNNISDITPLANLISLSQLYIWNNYLEDIDTLSSLTALSDLRISANDINDISSLESLSSLSHVELDGNILTNLAPLVANSNFAGGDYLYVNSNPLNLGSLSAIATMTGRGVGVYYSMSVYCGNSTIDSYLPKWEEQCDDGNNTNGDGCNEVCQLETGDSTPITFTDSNFEDCVRDALEIPSGPITVEDALTLTTLDCSYRSIASLSGIEYFTNLTNLYAGSNNIESIDLSSNTALETLFLSVNELSAIDVSGNTALEFLDISGNVLTSVDVSNNVALTTLKLYSNSLTSVDVSDNVLLTHLDLFGNLLTSIDISHNTALSYLGLNNNNLTSVDVSNNTALTQLYLGQNYLTGVDLSANTALSILSINDAPLLTSIDLSNNVLLTQAQLSSNGLTSLDLSANTLLFDLRAAENYLTSVTLPENTAITTLFLDDNDILDISWLVSNLGIGSLDYVTLYGNILSLAALDDISTLTGRGVNVEYDQLCGDEVVEGSEECDDGNNENGDGCSASCQTESRGGSGFTQTLTEPNPPTAPSAMTPTAVSSSSIQWNFADTASNEVGFKLYSYDMSLISQVASTNLSYMVETGLSPDVAYQRYLSAYNGDGESSYTQLGPVYTLANPPSIGTAVVTGNNSVSLSLDVNGNSSTTKYAIYESSLNKWLQVDWTLGASPVFQTYIVWLNGQTSIPVNGLTNNAMYVFKVEAQNGAGITTDLSEGTTIVVYRPANANLVLNKKVGVNISQQIAGLHWSRSAFAGTNGILQLNFSSFVDRYVNVYSILAISLLALFVVLLMLSSKSKRAIFNKTYRLLSSWPVKAMVAAVTVFLVYNVFQVQAFENQNGVDVKKDDVLTYQIEYLNNGAQTAHNIIVTEAIPVGTSYVAGTLSSTGNKCVLNSNVITCNVGDLVSNGSGVLEFKAKVTGLAGTSVINIANATYTESAVTINSNSITNAIMGAEEDLLGPGETRDVVLVDGWNTFRMAVTSKVRFPHNNSNHTVELTNSNLAIKTASVRVMSDPIDVSLKQGESKGVDSDGNKLEDMDVMIQSVESDAIAVVAIKSKVEEKIEPVCGDKQCNGLETCNTCPDDCGVCKEVSVCGDNKCNGAEKCNTCPGDCGVCPVVPVCGDAKCNGEETCGTCPGDCGACVPEKDKEELEVQGGAKHACSDGIDNDGDGYIDMDDYGCVNQEDDDETDEVLDKEQIKEQEKVKEEIKVEKEAERVLDSDTGNKVVDAVATLLSGITQADFKDVREEVKKTLVSTVKTAKEIGNATIDNPQVEKINKVAQDPVVAATTVATVASVATVGATGAASAGVLTYLQFLFTQPIMLLTRRRRQNWGIIYDSITKKPLDLAVIRLFEFGTNHLVTTRVTDRAGRYQFIVKPGKYYIEVSKKEHRFPSEVIPQLFGGRIDENVVDDAYQNLYNGGVIEVREGDAGIINRSIPVDPDKKLESDKDVFRRTMWAKVQSWSTLFGPIIAVISYIINPVGWVGALVVIQVVIYLVFKRLTKIHRALTWGRVKDLLSGKNLKKTVIRVFDTRFNKLLDTQITDSNGKYGFLVSRGEYYLTGNRDGYEPYKSNQIDLTQKDSAYIAEEIKMKKAGTIMAPTALPNLPLETISTGQAVVSPAQTVTPMQSTPQDEQHISGTDKESYYDVDVLNK